MSIPELLLAPAEAAARAGVSIDTIRRWMDDGKLTEHRTAGGHRRVDANELQDLQQHSRRASPVRRAQPATDRGSIGYARAHPAEDWKRALAVQTERLRAHGCDEVVTEVAAELGEIRPGLAEIMRWIAAGEVGELVVLTADRLGQPLAGLLGQFLAVFDARLTVLEAGRGSERSVQELVSELRSSVASYADRLFGQTSQASTLTSAIDHALDEAGVRDDAQ